MKNNKSGFTLLELIIVLAVSAIVMTIITSMFMSGLRVFANSDVKTTLQMDAKDIQERISDICMQASSIDDVDKDVSIDESSTDEFVAVSKLVINSYDNKDSSDDENTITIEKKGNTLFIDKYKVQSDVKSIKIDKAIVAESNEGENDFEQFRTINFYIELQGKKGLSEDITYPIKFTVTFRNNNIESV